ncbi:hypothetical protein GCM10023321_09110 [Pseudonocardia eucalypti]|uniref:Uncharacterized protein n=1 Tax=Pseudonocardia eucalypti TaxID=648755 RepID=A0ABP9PJP9_9PSEU
MAASAVGATTPQATKEIEHISTRPVSRPPATADRRPARANPPTPDTRPPTLATPRTRPINAAPPASAISRRQAIRHAGGAR